MHNLQRVNLLLEQQQRKGLEKLARERNRSISDLVREYITAGLKEDYSPQRERQLALERSRALSARITKQRKDKQPINAVNVISDIRDERTHELLGRRR
jgi:hypothetical protein